MPCPTLLPPLAIYIYILTPLVNICGFLALACILASRLRQPLVSVFPITAALWILMLYVLAFLRLLWLVDVLSALLILLCLRHYLRVHGKRFLSELLKLLFSPQAITVYIMLALAFFFFRDMTLTSRDDLGCWAIEAKSIFYYQGFAPAFQNAAASFGRYLPGSTLFRWWLCHLAGTFSEGLLAVGSAWLFILLLSPLLGCFSFSLPFALPIAVVGGGFLLTLPGVFDYMPYQSICAEPLLSAAFAGAWIVLFSRKHLASLPQLLAYLFLLCFFKASGFVYALFVVVFILFVQKNPGLCDEESICLFSLNKAKFLRGAMLCPLPLVLWYIYCAIMGRSNYTIATMAPESAGASAGLIYLRNFFTGIFTQPSHYVRDGMLDLPLFFLLLLLAALWFCAGFFCRGEARKALKALGCFYLAALALFFIAFLCMHCFLFKEALYFDAASLMSSCARYGEPFFLGAALFIFYRFASGCKGKTRLLFTGIFLCISLGCTCMWTVYYRVIDNAANTAQAEAFRQELRESTEPFLSLCEEQEPQRILFVYGSNLAMSDISRTNLQFLAAPNSLLYCYVEENRATEDALAELESLISDLRPGSVYFTGFDPAFLSELCPDSSPDQNRLIPLEHKKPGA